MFILYIWLFIITQINSTDYLFIANFKIFVFVKALKKMNAGDTPLNTVALFSEKQKQGQTPYLILSGGGQTFGSG